MSSRKMYFPFPALGHDDDVLGTFDGNPKYSYLDGTNEVLIELDLRVGNKEVQELIDGGKAAFGIDVQCSPTYYRHVYQTADPMHKIRIPETLLRGRVDIRIFIFTLEDILYSLKSFHKDFDGLKFSVPAGTYIGWWGEAYFIADKEFDPLQTAASSFIKVRPDHSNKKLPYATYDQNTITIFLHKSAWETFNKLKDRPKHTQSILHATLVLPFLAEAVDAIKEGKGETNDRLAAMLNARDDINLENEYPLEMAQKLLRDPIGRGMEASSILLDKVNEDKDD